MKSVKVIDGVNPAEQEPRKRFDFYCPSMPGNQNNYWKENCHLRQRIVEGPCFGGCSHIKRIEGRMERATPKTSTKPYGIRPEWFYRELEKLMLDKELTLDDVGKKLGINRSTVRSQYKKLKRDSSLKGAA